MAQKVEALTFFGGTIGGFPFCEHFHFFFYVICVSILRIFHVFTVIHGLAFPA
jgi:hypothetical protein